MKLVTRSPLETIISRVIASHTHHTFCHVKKPLGARRCARAAAARPYEENITVIDHSHLS